MRGYGGTTAPQRAEDYNVYTLASDAIGLVHRLGYETCVLVGHDWGGWLVWQLSVLHPSVFTAVCGMSVPYGPFFTLTQLRERFGDERKKESDPLFYYMLHHNLPEAAGQYGEDVRETLFRAYCSRPSDTAAARAEVGSSKLYVDGRAESMTRRVGRPSGLPSWLSEAELQYYVREFARAGFEGGLNWYRTMDINHVLAPRAFKAQLPVAQPALFLAGALDSVILSAGGAEKVAAGLKKRCANLQGVHFYPAAGHWIQQEEAADVNRRLLAWLDGLALADRQPRGQARL
jgi:pimeloyl-ACP methyl ester carboxylesterase